VKYTDLQSVLNFMYHGEVNVAQEELNSFLAVAEDLRVKGLTQNRAEASNSKSENYSQSKSSSLPKSHQRPPDRDPNPPPKRVRPPSTSSAAASSISAARFSFVTQDMDDDIQEVVPVKTEPRDPPPPPTPTAVPPPQDVYTTPSSHSLAPVEDDSFGYQDDQYAEYEQYEDGQEYGGGGVGVQANYPVAQENTGYVLEDPSDLLQFVRKEPTDKRFHCTLCDKFSHTNSYHTRNHVESQHFPNTFSYQCDQCDSVFSTKCNFTMHKSRKHKNKLKQQSFDETFKPV